MEQPGLEPMPTWDANVALKVATLPAKPHCWPQIPAFLWPLWIFEKTGQRMPTYFVFWNNRNTFGSKRNNSERNNSGLYCIVSLKLSRFIIRNTCSNFIFLIRNYAEFFCFTPVPTIHGPLLIIFRK